MVPDGKYNTLGEEPKAVTYRPMRYFDSTANLVARTEGDPRAVLAAIRREVQQLDPTLPLYDAKTLTEHMNIPLFPAKMAAGALGSFGVLALVLAAVGIYGVMSYVVAGRTREIGLRMALGAQSRSVGLLILKQGMVLALIGSAIGLALAFGGTRLLQSILYGVSAVDPVTFATVAFLSHSLPCWRVGCRPIAPRASIRWSRCGTSDPIFVSEARARSGCLTNMDSRCLHDTRSMIRRTN